MEKRKNGMKPQAGRQKGAAYEKKPQAVKKENAEKLSNNERKILSVLKKHGEEPVSSRTLLRETDIKNKAVFYDLLRHLQNNGKLKIDEKHRVTLAAANKGLRAELVSLSAGFGFAKPEDGSPDVFIHGRALNGAFVGDTVILTDVNQQEKGLEGKVKAVAVHTERPMTGTLKVTERGTFIAPDASIRYDLAVNPQDVNKAKNGDKVVFRPRQDYRGDWTSAKVTSVLGSGDSARICADAIIVEHGIPNVFPGEVLEEAKKAAAQTISPEELAARLDLRDEPIFTIDSADAKDLDDAICVKKWNDGYELGVHIADVSHYVREHTALDDEAFLRGTSVYFADRVIPMLPEDISNGVCSLNAGTDKLAFSAILHFDAQGELVQYDFKKSVINSKVRGVYSEVNEILGGSASEEILAKYRPVEDSLRLAKELSDILTENERKRGTMELESGELKFVLDEKGVCVDILPRSTGKAEALIEQMMVSANTAAAKFAQKHELPFLYRVHEKPQLQKLESLVEILDRLMIPCQELKTGKPATGDFAKVLDRVKGSGKEELVSQRILRTMEKARYAAEELGHFGLALQDYSHFTSPIRRYPDLSIHRILTAFLSGMPANKIQKKYTAFAENSAAQSTKNEIRAVQGERAAEDCYVAEYLKAHIGEKYPGVISGATGRGLFVRLPNGAEGFVSLDSFDREYIFDGVIGYTDKAGGHDLTVGDPLAIVVVSSDVATGRVDFVPDKE